MQEQERLTIGEVADASGLPASTIRFYEESGILPPARRSASGYRLYDGGDIARLRFVRNARALDFATNEVREVLALREKGQAPCEHVIALLEVKIRLVEERMRELEGVRGELRALLEEAAPLPRDDVEMKGCVCSLIREKR